MTDPASLSLTEAAQAIASGELGALDLLEACLNRIRVTAEFGAWVLLDADRARQEARRLTEIRSALHGIPVAIKDSVDVAGWPTRCGTVASDPAPATRDAAIVTLLGRAGALVLGKVATHEITFGVTTRAVRNPWDPERLAGGSSGGSAVAVCTGACPLAIGTDTAGSTRIPAALCGVAGLMCPRLATSGLHPLAPSLDTVGLLARSARDLAVAWRALTDESPAEPPTRIGVIDRRALGSVDSGVKRTVGRSLAALEGAGAEIVPVEMPPFADFGRAREVVIGAEALSAQREAGTWPARASDFGQGVREELTRAQMIDAGALAAARAEQRRLADRLRGELTAVDVLALPTTPDVAPRADEGESAVSADRRLAGTLTRLCGPINAAGLAAVSVPCGTGARGLPVGLQLVAPTERQVLGAALAYETVASPVFPATPARAAA